MTDFVSLLTIASHSDIDWILGIESQSWYNTYCIFRSFQVGQNDQNCDNGSAAETERSLGSSDDSIIRPGEETNGANTGSCGAGVDGTDRAQDTTHKSFIEKRKRHTSVPQTARTQVCGIKSLSVQWYWWTFIFLLVLEDLAENFLYCYTFANFIPAKTLQELYISLIFMTPYCYGPWRTSFRDFYILRMLIPPYSA